MFEQSFAQTVESKPEEINEEVFLDERSSLDAMEDIIGLDPLAEEQRRLLSSHTTTPTDPEKATVVDESASRGTNSQLRAVAKRIPSIVQTVLLFLLPSFIAAKLRKEDKPATIARYTTYLDGLRGLAAWAVLNTHLCARVSVVSGANWGTAGMNKEFHALPIVRLIYNGEFAVGLFFVISGFALSISPVVEMRKSPRNAGAAMSKLAGSIFRRPIRLFGPPIVAIFVAFVVIRLGVFERLNANMEVYDEFVQGWPITELYAKRMPSFWAQFKDMVAYDIEMLEFMTTSALRQKRTYNGVVWTIPVEFKASLILMLTHAALFHMRRPMRTASILFLIFMAFVCRNWEVPHFLAGFLIADYAELSAPEPVLGQTWLKRNKLLPLWWLIFLVGLFLGSYPEWRPEDAPFYSWLFHLTPAGSIRFWVTIGSMLTVLAISKLPFVIRILSTRPIHYLGQISFALYLVHFWIVHSFGTWLFYKTWSYTSRDTTATKLTGFFLGYPVLLFVVIWAADVFWRAVDQPLVSLAAKLHKRLFQEL